MSYELEQAVTDGLMLVLALQVIFLTFLCLAGYITVVGWNLGLALDLVIYFTMPRADLPKYNHDAPWY